MGAKCCSEKKVPLGGVPQVRGADGGIKPGVSLRTPGPKPNRLKVRGAATAFRIPHTGIRKGFRPLRGLHRINRGAFPGLARLPLAPGFMPPAELRAAYENSRSPVQICVPEFAARSRDDFRTRSTSPWNQMSSWCLLFFMLRVIPKSGNSGFRESGSRHFKQILAVHV